MRRVLMCFSMSMVIAGLAWSQAMTDAAGIIAGTSVGVGAGKKVSEGITSALQRVDATATKAAKPEKVVRIERPEAKPKQSTAAVLQVAPGGVVKDHSLVPPPPPKKVAVVPPPPPLVAAMPAVFQPMPVLPPPRQATAEDLKTIAGGASREEVLRLGAPASRITMFDDGHLVEIYRYQTRDTAFGTVRLSDGSVSSVQVR